MFFGLFIFLAGVISLLENTGVISGEARWGLPLAIICVGLSLIVEAYRSSKNASSAHPPSEPPQDINSRI